MTRPWRVVGPGDGGYAQFPWGEIRWLANQALGNSPELTFGKVVIRSGKRNATHRHSNCWELLYLLSGRLRHHFGGESAEMGPGELVVIAPGVPHWAQTISGEDATMVVVYSTGERRMEEVR